ncbi:MAG: hypothetical protein K6U87_14240 [Firmicutes bacterium]|nr:hypothetical protein [Bacillota bacterium]
MKARSGRSCEALSRTLQRLGRYRRLGRQGRQLNLQQLRRDLEEVARLADEVRSRRERIAEQVSRYRFLASTGDAQEWQVRFRRALQGKRPVEGEFPVFRVFPLEIRVDSAQELVEINHRTYRILHPEAVAELVLQLLARLEAERFNAGQFLRALAHAYDLAIAENASKGVHSRAVSLRRIYELLTLRSTRYYSWNQFGYDVYRLRQQGALEYEGRTVVFGSTRNRGLELTSPSGRREVIGSMELVPLNEGEHHGD